MRSKRENAATPDEIPPSGDSQACPFETRIWRRLLSGRSARGRPFFSVTRHVTSFNVRGVPVLLSLAATVACERPTARTTTGA